MRKPSLLLILTFFCKITIGFAQEVTVKSDTLFEMSLADLMNVTVVTASKNNESKKDAPAIISVISAKEIEGYGALSVKDLLDRVAGVYVNATYFSPTNISMRGDHTSLYDTHVLLLINGRPVRESFHNGVNMSVYEMFPLSAIERIEIIKGPGSVLYGTSAYTGVINIITKSSTANFVEGQIRYGSFQTVQANVSAAYKIKEIEIMGALQFLTDDGWKFTARDERAIIRNKANTEDSLIVAPKTIPMEKRGIGSFVQVKYKNFKVNAGYNNFDQRIMGRTPVWGTPIETALNNVRGFADAGYSHTFNKYYTSSINVTYNFLTHRQHVPLDGYKEDNVFRRANDVLAEWTHYFSPTDKSNIIIGVLSNTQTGSAVQPELNPDGTAFDLTSGKNPDPLKQLPDYNQTWYGAYAQADYTPFKWIKLIAGGQLNKVAGINANFVPRLGSIVTINSNWSAKLLYGQAFRSPSFFELTVVSLPAIAGNKELTPEVVGTLEGQVTYVMPKAEISLTYFNTRQSNMISRSNVRDSLYVTTYKGKLTSVPIYINKGSMDFQGLEVEGKAFLGKFFSATGSFAYQASMSDISYGMPSAMVKLGISYQNPSGFGLGIFNSYVGEGKPISTYNAKGVLLTKTVNPEVKAYNYLTANLNMDFFKLLKVKTLNGLIFNIYGVNLLDASVNYPELVRRNINAIPGRAGRSFFAGLSYKF